MYRYAEDNAGMPLQCQPQQYVPPQPMVIDRQDKEAHNRTPLCCAVFAFLCCPYGFCCATLAMVYGLCGYVDHRVNDLSLYRQRNSRARCCAVTAIVVGVGLPALAIFTIGFFMGNASFATNLKVFFARFSTTYGQMQNSNSGSGASNF